MAVATWCVTSLLLMLMMLSEGRRDLTAKRAYQEGDYIIGGIFPVHTAIEGDECTTFNRKGNQFISKLNFLNKFFSVLPT